MRRRNLIALIAGSVAAWPSVLSAQPAERIRVVGALMGQGNDPRSQANLAQLRDALRDLGWTDGRNLHLEVRWAAGEMDRTRTSALELAKLSPDVILAAGTTAIAALKQTTQSIPLVFVIVNDPVAQGFVASVAHPGSNITGFSYMDYSVLRRRCNCCNRRRRGSIVSALCSIRTPTRITRSICKSLAASNSGSI
jgi:putative tryptophan/tyrosine transport system substrate-binding protein